MSRKGKQLEQIVHALELVWADKKNVIIESPKKLRDKVTGRLREHDVVLTITSNHHTLTVALECRDRSRRVGVGEVEAFHQKCLNTGVDKGAIVSSKGFAKTARTKSQAFGISCLDIEEVGKFDWFSPSGMEESTVRVLQTHHSIILENDARPAIDEIEFINVDGIHFGKEGLFRFLQAYLDPHIKRIAPPGTKSGQYIGKIRFETPGLRASEAETGREWAVRYIVTEVVIQVDIRVLPFSFYSYSDKAHGTVISEAASVPIGFGKVKGELVFSHKKDEGIKVLFVKDQDGPKSGE